MQATAPELDDHLAMRRAGADLLSLALMDARNHSLQLHAAFVDAWEAARASAQQPSRALDAALLQAVGVDRPDLWLGRLGWFQEAWIARNVQRRRGRACDPQAARLASIDPEADALWDARQTTAAAHPGPDRPHPEAVRRYLVDTLEVTLDLLQQHPQDDDSLYFFRLALFHEDAQAERLLDLAQALGLTLPQQRWPDLQPRAAAIALPGGTQTLGWRDDEPGFTFEADRGRVTLALQGGEIDATPVTWQQYLAFIQDGGYDDPAWWSEAGWRWRTAQDRRAPRQARADAGGGAVILQRGGRPMRVALQQPVLQVSAHEAQAWCRWAGRRLPTEAEWEAAALRLGPRGFRWGSCWEWTADRLAARPADHPSDRPATDQAAAAPAGPAPGHPQHLGDAWGRHVVLRGGSLHTRRRLIHARRRWHAEPQCDHLMVGFRSCGM